jgi:hypothetical protein
MAMPGIYVINKQVVPQPLTEIFQAPVRCLFVLFTSAPKQELLTDVTSVAQLRERSVLHSLSVVVMECLQGFFSNGGEFCDVLWIPVPLFPHLQGQWILDLPSAIEGDAMSHLPGIASFEGHPLGCPDYLAIPELDNPDLDLSPSLKRQIQQGVIELCEKRGDLTLFYQCYTLPPPHTSQGSPSSQLRKSRHACGLFPGVLTVQSLKRSSEAVTSGVGHVLGALCKVTRETGNLVHSPANQPLKEIIALAPGVHRSHWEQARENRLAPIRLFRQRGVRLWGDVNLAGEPESVARGLYRLKRTLKWGLLPYVFEPNSPALQSRVERDIKAFLELLFERGVLKGNSPKESFVVHCDAERNTPESVAAGLLQVEVGVALAEPLEFIFLHLIQNQEMRTRG